MNTVMFERARIDELTKLSMALKVSKKEEFLSVKQRLLGSFFDKEAQINIWEDYHDLIYKAACNGFEDEDFEKLESYRQLEGCFELVSDETRMFFPTQITRNESGEIVGITLRFLDNEVTKRWFEHIYNILMGAEEVQVCAADDCDNLFIKSRKDHKFCSKACRNRQWQREYR